MPRRPVLLLLGVLFALLGSAGWWLGDEAIGHSWIGLVGGLLLIGLGLVPDGPRRTRGSRGGDDRRSR